MIVRVISVVIDGDSAIARNRLDERIRQRFAWRRRILILRQEACAHGHRFDVGPLLFMLSESARIRYVHQEAAPEILLNPETEVIAIGGLVIDPLTTGTARRERTRALEEGTHVAIVSDWRKDCGRPVDNVAPRAGAYGVEDRGATANSGLAFAERIPRETETRPLQNTPLIDEPARIIGGAGKHAARSRIPDSRRERPDVGCRQQSPRQRVLRLTLAIDDYRMQQRRNGRGIVQ